MTTEAYRAPWKMRPLDEWAIVVLQRYRFNGHWHLRVVIELDGHYIQETGIDDEYVWNRLWRKVDELARKETP